MSIKETLRKNANLLSSVRKFAKVDPVNDLDAKPMNDTIREQYAYQSQSNNIIVEENDMAKDLMIMVGSTIEQWAQKYNMENLPKKIVFNQALAIMNAMEEIIFIDK